MARARNYNIYSTDPNFLARLAEDYEYIGREVRRDPRGGQLSVLAMPVSYKKKRLAESKLRARRKAREAYGEDEVEARYDEE